MRALSATATLRSETTRSPVASLMTTNWPFPPLISTTVKSRGRVLLGFTTRHRRPVVSTAFAVSNTVVSL